MESGGKDSTTDPGAAARSVTYAIRHVIRKEALDDALAMRHARALLLEPLVGLNANEEYDGLVEALRSDVRLSTWWGDPRFERVIPEEDFRAHLGRVVERMDAMRPWPTPLLRALDPELWRDYVDPRQVGVIRLSVPKVERRLRVHLTPITTGSTQHQVAVLELRSGRQVAVVGHWWADALRATAVLTRDPDASAADLIAELTSGDDFEPGEVEVVED